MEKYRVGVIGPAMKKQIIDELVQRLNNAGLEAESRYFWQSGHDWREDVKGAKELLEETRRWLLGKNDIVALLPSNLHGAEIFLIGMNTTMSSRLTLFAPGPAMDPFVVGLSYRIVGSVDELIGHYKEFIDDYNNFDPNRKFVPLNV